MSGHPVTVLVLGLGTSGLAMARWCARSGQRVLVADSRAAPPQAAALAAALPGVALHHGFDPALLDGEHVVTVLKSPGLSPRDPQLAPLLAQATALGIPVQGELQLFVRALAELKTGRGYAPKVVAITGTNGKTTTTVLCGALIARTGWRVALAGNVGPSLLQTLADALDLEDAAAASASAPATEQADPPVDADVNVNVTATAAVGSAGAAAPADAVAAAPPPADPDAAALPDRPAPEPAAWGEDLPDLSDGDTPPDAERDDGSPVSEVAAAAADGGGDGAGDEAAPPLPEPIAPPAPAPVFAHLPQAWVLELSSFQLDGVQGFAPDAAVVLNVTQDHLDWHGSMAAYTAAKAGIYGAGDARTAMVINRDDPAVEAMLPQPMAAAPARRGKGRPAKAAAAAGPKAVRFGLGAPRAPGDFGLVTDHGVAWLARAAEADPTDRRRADPADALHVQRLMPADALRLRGRHNASNALAALALATAIGRPLAPMLHALREARGEPHRVELIATVGEVEAFDDSKGTNVGATVAALDGLGADRAPAKLVVILGGDGKGQDFAPLAGPVARHARAVALIGRDAEAIAAVLDGGGVPLQHHATLEAATRWCFEQARPGDAVLLSPACASLDMFRDYAHRAAVFAETVRAVALDRGQPA